MKDGTKSGGRKKGTPNKDKAPARALAEKLGVDPLEILLLFAKGDYKALGYDSEKRVVGVNEFGSWEDYTIPVSVRKSAAADAAKYLFPQLKSIEHKGDGPGNPFNALAQAVASILKANPDAESKPGSSS